MSSLAQYHLDLAAVSKKVTTDSEDAQAWFNKGLAMAFGYNHEEAARLFGLAVEADPKCAMAHWGIANALIGNYNNPGGLDEKGAAEAQAKAAESLTDSSFEWERTLISAMKERVNAEDEKNKQSYAEALRAAHGKFQDDPDVACLFTESLMMLAPWAMWTPFAAGPVKETMPETLEAQAVLEGVFVDHPKHAGACHLYIHLMELSANPEKALPMADVLRTRVPGQGHLVHMASHIDMWCGNYKEALEANIKAVDADNSYVKLTGNDENFYKFYRMHNHHFAVWAAMFDGQFSVAMDYARRASNELNEQHVQFMLGGAVPMGKVFLEAFAMMPFHVLLRFGKWEDVLKEPIPENREAFAGTVAHAHYARGVALAAMGRVDEAAAEQEKFLEAYASPALDGRVMHNNVVVDREGNTGVLDVAKEYLAGELEYRRGNLDQAFEHLREAVRRDANLKYDEPWGWMMPSRHALGALLAEAGRFEEARSVFEADLAQYKDNMWGLRGLRDALVGAKADPNVIAAVEQKLTKAEMRCEEKFAHACFCANGKKG